jgi:PPK2 family polyphosphate:nucleotide phosphotransferase
MKSKNPRKLLDRYRVISDKGFRLKDHDPDGAPSKLIDRDDADRLLAEGVSRLAELQEKLYAQDRWALLCVFQAMDAAGKDGTVKHVMSGVNPSGVQVTSFKAPGPDDLAHDFLWRVHRAVPQRGRIGIFNRSHYEEVLVVRVHPDMLEAQRLPDALVTDSIWKHRLKDIACFERYLSRQGIVILKFFLNISANEQRERFLARLDDPEKNWKFSEHDLAERAHWDAYMEAYEQAIAATASEHAPWYVVPANHKWFAHLIVVEAMIDALEKLGLQMPEPTPQMRDALERARKALGE